VTRTLSYEFPKEKKCWEVGSTQYMYGDEYLYYPMLEPGARTMAVYFPMLPDGDEWASFGDSVSLGGGGESKVVDCPLETMPVFVRRRRSD